MGSFEELIQNLITPLLAYPEDFEIENQGEQDGYFVFDVKIKEDDLGRVVGKGGHIAKAIRTILYAKASKDGKKVRLNIDAK
ncbi:MAG: KH domain-containing protein [Acholeplasmatales bacterium]|nr:KH domain-containing protein [Acholeplasmatales bacterium]